MAGIQEEEGGRIAPVTGAAGRPVGITVLAVLYAIAAVAYAGLPLVTGLLGVDLARVIRVTGGTSVLTYVNVCVCVIFLAATSAMLLKGYFLGWWSASAGSLIGLLSGILNCVVLFAVPSRVSVPPWMFAKCAGGVVVSGLVLSYLLRNKVLCWYFSGKPSRWRRLGICFGIAVIYIVGHIGFRSMIS
jgi:hypothetical protein